MTDKAMTDKELEQWSSDRVARAFQHFRSLSDKNARIYAEDLIRKIIILSADLDITDWDEDLHLADVLDKYIGRRVLLTDWRGTDSALTGE